MNIEKEREAFEAWFESRYDAHFMQFALDLDFYVDKHTQTCWEAWQAAKAQAVPDGFVLVPKEIPDSVIERLRYSSYHWGDGTRDYFTPVYQIMIEAAQGEGHE